jgi:acetyltransferase-like isoleucine patch superfamily enzyme
MSSQKIIILLKILISIKFYWFVLSDLFSYFSKIIRKYEMRSDQGRILLGKNTYIDRSTDLIAPKGYSISIGDRTTINCNCVIIGDVKIENNCLLSYNIYISSGNHQATLVPEWLIRDQDYFYTHSQQDRDKQSSLVHIEEDCWIGWGVFIKQGIYIGRGAVIGASAVITRDVPPYSIHVGIPNREISHRLDFDPPSYLNATKSKDLPYFYCGFVQEQSEIKKTLQSQMLLARRTVRLMLKGGSFHKISLAGKLNKGIHKMKLYLICNGFEICELVADSSDFNISHQNIDVRQNEFNFRSPVLAKYNEIEIKVIPFFDNTGIVNSNQIEYPYGIKSVEIYSH